MVTLPRVSGNIVNMLSK